MEIAVLLFDELTVLDAAGPAEVLGRMPGARIKFVAKRSGVIASQSRSSRLSLVADHQFKDVSAPDVVLVPGGPGYVEASKDVETIDWLCHVHDTSIWTTSVCTGSLILGAADLLAGLHATTHWSMMDKLAEYGAIPTKQRIVRDGKLLSGAGVSAGIDLALELAALIAGKEQAQAIQIQIEYEPSPPFDCGDPTKAPPEVRQLLGI